EAEQLAGSIHAAGAAIITLGADGCVLVERGQRRSFSAESASAVDTTGCGDAFCGVMAAALARGFATDEAIGAAQKAAALTATRPGAFQALPSREELGALLANRRPGALKARS